MIDYLAAMTVDKDALVAALRLRYDYFSAESVFEIVRQRAGLDNKASLDAAELAAFRAALVAHGDRTDRVVAQVDELLGGAPAAAPAPAEPAKPAAEPAKPAKGGKGKEPEAARPAEAAPAKAAEPAPVAGSIATTISLKGLEVAVGEQVMMCGGLSELGDWDPEKARPLTREGELWSTTIKLAPDAEVSFKFLRRDAEGKVVWETGDNRSVTAAKPLDATWR
ncbi:hypothetical protein BH11MYX3_BH11MYX3_21510 [soil metagenome]